MALSRDKEIAVSPTPYKSRLLEDELRVVRISPGRWDEPLVASLITCKFALASMFCPYTALSYVWGNASVTDIIELDGVWFKVALNLSCSLKHLRNTDKAILLWVDALCINQEDEHERSWQVRIMQNIYQNAQQVLVFIGDSRGHRLDRSKLRLPPGSLGTNLYGDERDGDFLDDLLRKCQGVRPRQKTPPVAADICAMGLIRGLSDREHIESFFDELRKIRWDIRTYMFECLREFVISLWWARIWVVQEVTVNNSVIIRYGNLTTSWNVFVQAASAWLMGEARELMHNADLGAENVKVFELFENQVSGLEQTRIKWGTGGGISLVRLLQDFSHRRASDDRDKVYGLLSLAKKRQQLRIRPDYSDNIFNTYRKTVLALIEIEATLTCWCGDQRRKNHRALPSWVPDWSTAFDLGDRRRMALVEYYAANRGWTLAVVYTAQEYWSTVSRDIKRLLESLACRSRSLPASLRPYLSQYMGILENLERRAGRERDDIRLVISQCEQLSSMCTAIQTTSKSRDLFRSSYIFQGDTTWLAASHLRNATRHVREAYSIPGSDKRLTIQTIAVDYVTDVGSRLLGWTDSQSAFSVLASWLVLLQRSASFLRGSGQDHWHTPRGSSALKYFAETLLGGLCWRDSGYRKAEQMDLSALEKWLLLYLRNYIFSMPPSSFLEDIDVATDGRVFFLTKNGSMGLGPASIESGDTIHIFPGGRTHFVLRKRFKSHDMSGRDLFPELTEDMGSLQLEYVLVGDCYLHSDGISHSQVPDGEVADIDGSLPYEFLGEEYLESVLPEVETITLV